MKIERDREKNLWALRAGTHVLYQGRRSPWDHPEIIRAALAAERALPPARSERRPG